MQKRCKEWKSSHEKLTDAVYSSEVKSPGSRFISDEGCDNKAPFKVCDQDDVVEEDPVSPDVTSCVYMQGKFMSVHC